ncbi:MAG: HEAT repeat domain-containing protein [Peptostreptococcaceae bacterium]
MQNATRIYIMISFFIYIISSSIIYMIIKDMINNKSNEKVKKLKTSFKKEVLKQLQDIKLNKKISKMNIDYMKDKLQNKDYFKAFNNILIEFNEDKNNHELTKEYMANFEEIILKNISKSNRKDDTIKTYQSYLLGQYKINNFEISEFLLNGIKSKSINLRVSSLKSIAQIGKIENFMKALIYISDENKYINNKMLCDIIDEFSGDKSLLDKILIEQFNLFNDSSKKTIIEHFKNKNIEFTKEKLLLLLKDNESSKEIKISIIKYFSKIKYDLAQDEIINILNEKDWEYRAVCATALGNYESIKTKEALLNSIRDKNWHVRYNSSISLLKFDDKDTIYEVFDKNDNYAKDILLYAMYMKDEDYYKYYIKNTNKEGVECIC